MVNWQLKRTIEKVSKEIMPDKKVFNTDEILFIMEELVKYSEESKEKNTGFKMFKKFIEYIFNRAIQNYDNMLLLSGEKGTGKSSAGIMICREFLRIQGRNWDPKKYIAYTNSQLMKLIDDLPPFSPILCDEAINFASGENWNKPENKELKIKLGVVRTKHLFFVLCLPWQIKKLDKVYFDSYINYWIDLYGRGIGCAFVKDKNPAGDPWKLKNFQDLGAYNEFTSHESIEKKLRKHPNFWNLIKIPKVPKKIYNDYLNVRESNIYNNDNVMTSVTKKDAVMALMLKALYDITLKGSTFSVKRLRKHFSEKYKIEVPLVLINELFKDSEMLSKRIMEEKTIDNLK